MITFRPADPNEADILSRIAYSAKSHWGYPERWLEIWKPQLTITSESLQTSECWVAEDGDRQIGFFILREKNGNAWLEDLWVIPEYIGRGIGGRLFLQAVRLARERGYKIMQLEADPNTIGFYEKMGMKKIGERNSEVDDKSHILPIMEIDL